MFGSANNSPKITNSEDEILSSLFSSDDLMSIMQKFRNECDQSVAGIEQTVEENTNKISIETSPQKTSSDEPDDSDLCDSEKKTIDTSKIHDDSYFEEIPTPESSDDEADLFEDGKYKKNEKHNPKEKLKKEKVKSEWCMWGEYETKVVDYFANTLQVTPKDKKKLFEHLIKDYNDENDNQEDIKTFIPLIYAEYDDENEEDILKSNNEQLILKKLESGKLSLLELPEKVRSHKSYIEAAKKYEQDFARRIIEKRKNNIREHLDKEELECLDKLIYQNEQKLPRSISEIIEFVKEGKITNLSWLDNQYRQNETIVTLLVKHNGNNLEFASEDLKKNVNVIREAMRNDISVIRYVAPSVQSQIICFFDEKTEQKHFFFEGENLNEMKQHKNFVPYVYRKNEWIVRQEYEYTSRFFSRKSEKSGRTTPLDKKNNAIKEQKMQESQRISDSEKENSLFKTFSPG